MANGVRWRKRWRLRGLRSRPTFLLDAQSSYDRQNPMPGPETTMSPGLRPLLIALCLGQALAFWMMSGQYSPGDAPAADPKGKETKVVASGESPSGKFWGNDNGKSVVAWG